MSKSYDVTISEMPVFSLTVSEFMGMLDARIAALLNESKTAPQMVQEPEARYEYSSKAFFKLHPVGVSNGHRSSTQ